MSKAGFFLAVFFIFPCIGLADSEDLGFYAGPLSLSAQTAEELKPVLEKPRAMSKASKKRGPNA